MPSSNRGSRAARCGLLLLALLPFLGCRRLESIEVRPADAVVARTTTLKLTATGVYSDGTREDLSARAQWASLDEKIVTVSGAGEATGRAVGVATVTAAYEKKVGSAPVEVGPTPLAALAIEPAQATVNEGALVPLAVFATDVEGVRTEVTGQVSWSSDSPAVSVSNPTSIRGVSQGKATLTATSSGLTAQATVEVQWTCKYSDLARFVPPVGSIESRERKSLLELSELVVWRSPVKEKHEAALNQVLEAARSRGLTLTSKPLKGALFELELACGSREAAGPNLRLPSKNPCSREEKGLMELTGAPEDPRSLEGVALIEYKFEERSDEELTAARRKFAVAGVDPLGGLPIMRPADVAGSCQKPHYGVGRFFTFTPVDRQLPKGATLSIQYTVTETAKLDTSHLGLYRWSDAAGDWELIPSEHRRADRTIVARIDGLGTYTLAPSMPSGAIVLVGRAKGSDWTFSARSLHTNDGRPVADGTAFTVVSFTPAVSVSASGGVKVQLPAGSVLDLPEGTFLTPDASPEEPGHQVLSRGGVISFELRYAERPAQLVVFSTSGTAVGSLDVSPRR